LNGGEGWLFRLIRRDQRRRDYQEKKKRLLVSVDLRGVIYPIIRILEKKEGARERNKERGRNPHDRKSLSHSNV